MKLARPEQILFLCLLAVFNMPLFFGTFAESLIFTPDAVRAGEWWRLFTHAFVHVTWYHFLLDGAAFLMLVQSLADPSLGRRISYVIGGIAGGLLTSWWATPSIATTGLCGLSGVAHGLMAVSALELCSTHPARSAAARYGQILFVLVAGKAAIEAVGDKMFFTFLHFGLMGEPVAVSHAGGVIGALSTMLLLSRLKRSGRSPGQGDRPCAAMEFGAPACSVRVVSCTSRAYPRLMGM